MKKSVIFILVILVSSTIFFGMPQVNSTSSTTDSNDSIDDSSQKLYDFYEEDVVNQRNEINNKVDKEGSARNQDGMERITEFSSSDMNPSIGVDAISYQNFFHGNTLTVSGVAEDDGDDLENINVYLFENISRSQLIQNYNTSVDCSSITECVDQTTTGNDGSFSFSVDFTADDLNVYNYSAYYPNQDDGGFGQPCFVCSDIVTEQGVIVQERINFDVVSYNPTTDNQATEFGPAAKYNITLTVTDSSGSKASPVVGGNLSYIIKEDYANSSIDDTNQTGTVGQDNIVSYINEYPGNFSDTITITSNLTNTDDSAFKHYDFQRTTDSFTIDIVTEYQLLTNLKIKNGTDFQNFVNGTRIYRYNNMQNQSFRLFGNLQNNTVISQTLDKSYNITIKGGGLSPTEIIFGTANITGHFNHSFGVSWANFTDPLEDITVITNMTNPDDGTLLTETFIIKLKTNITRWGNMTIDKSLTDGFLSGFYWNGDNTNFTMSGILYDEFNQSLTDVTVTLRFDQYQNASNSIVDSIDSTTMQSSGFPTFNFTTQVPDFNDIVANLTLNATIDKNLQRAEYRIDESFNMTYVFGSFKYIDRDALNYTIILNTPPTTNNPNNLIPDGPNPFIEEQRFNVFNGTYVTYLDSDNPANYTIQVTDRFGRIPNNIDVTLNYTFQSTNIQLTRQINSTNNGLFTFAFSEITPVSTYKSLLNNSGIEFEFEFQIGTDQGNFNTTNFGTYNSLINNTFRLFGPDHDLSITNPNIQIPGNQNATESSGDLRITFSYDDITNITRLANIRNVTIAYRITTQGGYNESEILDGSSLNMTLFNNTWVYANMTFNNQTFQFEYTFPFSNYGHGYWFVFNITVYDLAGHGLYPNEVTVAGSNWINNPLPSYNSTQAKVERPTYDVSVANQADITFNGKRMQVAKMGDLFINKVNVTEDIRFNGSLYTAGNFTGLNDIPITLELTEDGTGYDTVIIYYRFLIYNENTGKYEVVTSSSLLNYLELNLDALNVTNRGFISLQLTEQGTTGGVTIFTGLIPESELNYGYILDFALSYNDTANNQVTTQPFFNATLSTPGDPTNQNQNAGKFKSVQDTSKPNVGPSNFNTLAIGQRGHTTRETIIWTNETGIYYITYNITDIINNKNGTGISDVVIRWYFNGTEDNVTELVLNGLVNGTPVGQTYFANFTIPEEYFVANTNISWVLEVQDKAGNTRRVNQQDNNPAFFSVVSPPQDDNGGTGDGTGGDDPSGSGTTGGGAEEDTNNALWIIAGFLGILGLLILWYQRHNIWELVERYQRIQKARSTLTELTDEIKRLGSEKKYKRAIMLTWETLERLSREIIQVPRKYNQTAREYASYLSTVTMVDRETLLTLSSAFEKCRYGNTAPTQDDWADAVKALEITIDTVVRSGVVDDAVIEEEW